MSKAQELQSGFEAVAQQLYGSAAEITRFDRLSGGASQETWAIDIRDGGETHRTILRRAPDGTESFDSSAIGLESEAQLIERAEKGGVPVPKVLHVLKPEDRMGRGFLMNRVEGETIARKILRDEDYAGALPKLAYQCGEALAGIHKIDPDGIDNIFESDGLSQVERYEETYRAYEAPRPIFELAIAWLKDNAPEPVTPVLVHGDFRLGNLMIQSSGLASVLDWELAHIGDPREDFGWICTNSWRFGGANRVGGFGTGKDLLEGYKAAGGAAFTDRDIDWWEMLGSLKWGIMCMSMYESFRSGMNPSVERAAIGRRVSETEIDLVNLLEARCNA